MQARWKSFLSLGKAEFEKDSFIIIIIIIIIVFVFVIVIVIVIVIVVIVIVIVIIIIGLILKWSENVCLGTHWLSLAFTGNYDFSWVEDSWQNILHNVVKAHIFALLYTGQAWKTTLSHLSKVAIKNSKCILFGISCCIFKIDDSN